MVGRNHNRCPLRHDLNLSLIAVEDCKPLGRETRRHNAKQVRKLAKSLEQFGFVLPIDGVIGRQLVDS